MSADNTTEAASAPNSGVSLEVGATYRAPSGNVVELMSDRVDRFGRVAVFCPSENEFGVASADHLERVAPTPADRWLTLHGEDTAWTLHDSQEEAEAYLADTSKVLRLARFTFAEWIDTEDATNG